MAEAIVPVELDKMLDLESVAETHMEWQAKTLGDVRRDTADPVYTEFGRAVVLEPASGEWDETTVVLPTPYAQSWKPSIAIRAEFAHQIVAPLSRMVVLPNQPPELYAQEALSRIADGNLDQFFERHVRVLEAVGVTGKVMLSGYSLGGLSVFGIAKVCSDKFEVTAINSDEAPIGGRTPKQLRKDFLVSSSWSDQRAAIADAQFPALSEALNGPRLAMDYARFGLASLRLMNSALHTGMAKMSFDELVSGAKSQYPNAPIKVGRVAGSKIVQIEYVPNAGVVKRYYSGEGSHEHATGDNVVAHALMMYEGLRPAV